MYLEMHFLLVTGARIADRVAMATRSAFRFWPFFAGDRSICEKSNMVNHDMRHSRAEENA
jgi:hypothetical protein